jgi:hypothetical protein
MSPGALLLSPPSPKRYQALLHSPVGRISPAMVVRRAEVVHRPVSSQDFCLAPVYPTFCTAQSLTRSPRHVIRGASEPPPDGISAQTLELLSVPWTM